jgi:hypothetical protein
MRRAVVYLLFTTLLLVISISSLRNKSVTADEPAHLPSGYSYLATGDFRLNPEHPPLVKVLSALPLLIIKPKIDLGDSTWVEGRQWEFGKKFLYEWNDADRLLFWGRLPIILLAAGIGIFLSFAARELYGEKAGYLALALYLFNPDLLAHGQLVTTDLAASGFIFLSVYLFYRTLRHLTILNILFTCLAVGLALISKFSGLFTFPMMFLVGVFYAYSKNPVKLDSGWKFVPPIVETRRAKFAAAIALIVVTGLAGLIVIWGSYTFRYSAGEPVSIPNAINADITRTINWQKIQERMGRVVQPVRAVFEMGVLPEAYLHGFRHFVVNSRWRDSFLHGQYSNTGWRYYFLVTFLVKTTIPLIILIVLGIILIRRYGAGMAAEAMLLAPVVFFMATAMASHINIGHRHILPIYPFLIVSASKIARAFDPPRHKVLAAVCALLVSWNIVETALIYPHFLSYFNQIVGGPSNGYQWLVDSNIDWGQDMKGLANYMRQHPDEEVYLSYFGHARPEYYGVKPKILPGYPYFPGGNYVGFDQIPSGATVAVSAANLQCVLTKEIDVPGIEQFMRRLREMRPVAEIGYSIKIYRLP